MPTYRAYFSLEKGTAIQTVGFRSILDIMQGIGAAIQPAYWADCTRGQYKIMPTGYVEAEFSFAYPYNDDSSNLIPYLKYGGRVGRFFPPKGVPLKGPSYRQTLIMG